MTLAILIGVAAILLSAGYVVRRQRLDTLEFRAGRIPASRCSEAPVFQSVERQQTPR